MPSAAGSGHATATPADGWQAEFDADDHAPDAMGSTGQFEGSTECCIHERRRYESFGDID